MIIKDLEAIATRRKADKLQINYPNIEYESDQSQVPFTIDDCPLDCQLEETKGYHQQHIGSGWEFSARGGERRQPRTEYLDLFKGTHTDVKSSY
mmetsp:Transcript_18076/g.37520  ORF Transcript_18076/g.37520 Transcript_18076/m.37520 type:complete len:94 (-) Transcript_18076:54-335(-)